MPDRPVWATSTGLPSRHIAQAAMHVASIIDASGSPTADAQESYWHRATGGRYPPADLALGQTLLIDLGLVIERDGVLHLTDALAELLNGTAEDAPAALTARLAETVPDLATRLDARTLSDLIFDPDLRDELLLQLAQRVDDGRHALVGAAGERLVVAEARRELQQLDRPDLARQVRRVSLTSDQLGYDVRAPRLEGQPRRLEVKATAGDEPSSPDVRIFLSRNEAETGRRLVGWSLVCCHITDLDTAAGTVLGWWPYEALAERLPQDVGGGRWAQAELTLALADARAGLPSAIL